MKKELPSQDYLNSILEYRDGLLYWKVSKPKVQIGMLAGTKNKDGYYHICIDQKVYNLHRIVWKMFNQNDPSFIDHINHNRSDNRIENLRNVTVKDNNKNSSKRKDNTSGHSGITIAKDNRPKKYQVKLTDQDGKRIKKGFASMEEAISFRDKKYIDFGYHENHCVIDGSNIL